MFFIDQERKLEYWKGLVHFAVEATEQLLSLLCLLFSSVSSQVETPKAVPRTAGGQQQKANELRVIKVADGYTRSVPTSCYVQFITPGQLRFSFGFR